MVSTIALVAGGGLASVWAVVGVLQTDGVARFGGTLLLGSYACTALGVGCLGWLAHRRDDAITAGMTPLAIGLALVVPVPIGVTGVVTAVPFRSVFVLVTAVGLLGVAFGGVVSVTTLLFSEDSTLVAPRWGRAAALSATAGVLGWTVSQAFGRADGALAFVLVTPHTAPTRVAAPGRWVVLAASVAGGLALCLLGLALVRRPSEGFAAQRPG